MFTQPKLSAIALSVLLGVTALSYTVSSSAENTAKSTEKAEDKAMIKTMDEAFKMMREVRAARLAIFNGATGDAIRLVKEAQADMRAVQSGAQTHSLSTHKTSSSGDSYVPFDSSIGLVEGFKATPEKQAALSKANSHLAKGEQKKAITVLKETNVDVTFSAALIPVKASASHLNDAADLLGQNKFYEANLALKALEDSVIIDSYGVDEIPEQGHHK